MKRPALLLVAVFAVGGLAGWHATGTRGPAAFAQQPDAPPAKAEGAEAGVKAITADYVKAFNAADAKAAALLWTATGEYVGDDGEPVVGRDEIEKSLAAYFKAHPKATAEVRVESVRAMGRGLASVEGVVTIKLPGAESPSESRYTALHVNEDGRWPAASVAEWVPDPATDVSTKNLEWLVGEWESKGDGGELKIVYALGEEKVFLTGKYTLTKNGEVVSKGTQVIGRNPAGGLRSWMFDSTGTTSDAIWVRDEGRWISEADGVLPDGTTVFSVNVLIPLGPDAFTWQTTEREVNGEAAPGLPPVKVTRVKK